MFGKSWYLCDMMFSQIFIYISVYINKIETDMRELEYSADVFEPLSYVLYIVMLVLRRLVRIDLKCMVNFT